MSNVVINWQYIDIWNTCVLVYQTVTCSLSRKMLLKLFKLLINKIVVGVVTFW